jgi:hypothetical protein
MEASPWWGKTGASEGARAMPFDAPFKLGPFSVDDQGRLTPYEPASAPAFLFRWQGRVVRARLGRADADTGRLTLQATLARVCSSASAPDAAVRPRSFALLRWLERVVPKEWDVALSPDHRVLLTMEAPIGLPVTASALITELTRFALDLAPYLALMDEVGLTVPGPGAG